MSPSKIRVDLCIVYFVKETRLKGSETVADQDIYYKIMIKPRALLLVMYIKQEIKHKQVDASYINKENVELQGIVVMMGGLV